MAQNDKSLQDKLLIAELSCFSLSLKNIFTSFHDDVLGRESIVVKFCKSENYRYIALDARDCAERTGIALNEILNSNVKTIVAVSGFEMSRSNPLALFQDLIDTSHALYNNTIFIFFFGKTPGRFKEIKALDTLHLATALIFAFAAMNYNEKNITKDLI